jgi:hypothetical protein
MSGGKAAAFVAVLVALLAAGSDASAGPPGPPTVRPAQNLVRPWHLSHAHDVGSRGLWVAVTSGFCFREPRPHIDHVKVVEQGAKGGAGHGSAIVTAVVHYPARDTSKPCQDLGLTLEKFVRLRRPVARIAIYDGAPQPPRLVRGPGGR